MAGESTATTVWEGSLTKGQGTMTSASGAVADLEVTWPARVERTEDTTSPEELLAAAHAACFCMGLSKELDDAGNAPDRLEATATISFVGGEGVKASHIAVKGQVPGSDQEAFEQAANAAAEGCPISGALKGNVEISVEATLEG